MSNVVTPKFRVSYPNVFKPQVNKLSNKEEYSLTALFDLSKDSPEFAKLKAAATEAIEKKWGKDRTQWPQNLKTPFRDQGERAKFVEGKKVLPAGYEEGKIFISLKSAQKPGVVDLQVQPILNEAEFYSGCFAIASVRAYAYDQKGNRGVSFGLGNIQKVADGDPLGGSRTRPSDDFAPMATSETSGGGGGADPFL